MNNIVDGSDGCRFAAGVTATNKAPVLVRLAAGDDLIARELAERLRTITGDQYIVENKPGAAQRPRTRRAQACAARWADIHR